MRPPSLLRCSRCWRGLSTSVSLSARHQDHYAVLKLPHNATKAQIKARFYELSKKTHPDAPGGSSTAFHTINDARAGQRVRIGHGKEGRWGWERTWGKAAPGPAWTGRRKVDPNLGWGWGWGSSGHNSTGDLGGMRWGKKESPREKANREKRFGAARRKEEIEGESTGVRLLVVVILLFCIMGIGGGFSTSSAEVEEELD
ncbi:hypothetical protein CcaverHIS002_0403490 [Cutaneotrichosporon cavernicola]|nr:hypothetical protein CcaverHIS002_0403490 [Cutaneotrichosporon cavernicola]